MRTQKSEISDPLLNHGITRLPLTTLSSAPRHTLARSHPYTHRQECDVTYSPPPPSHPKNWSRGMMKVLQRGASHTFPVQTICGVDRSSCIEDWKSSTHVCNGAPKVRLEGQQATNTAIRFAFVDTIRLHSTTRCMCRK